MTAYILAGGKGERAAPFTVYRNKAVMPVGNVPLVKRTASSATFAGAEKTVVACGRGVEEIRALFAGDEAVAVAEVGETSGNAKTLEKALRDFPCEGDALILFGDCYYDGGELRALAAALAQDGPQIAVLAGQELEKGDAENFITCKTGGGQLRSVHAHVCGGGLRPIEAIAARRGALEELLLHSGIFAGVAIGDMPPLEVFLEAGLSNLLSLGQAVAAVEGAAPFVDIDKPWSIMEANYLAVEREAAALAETAVGEGSSISPEAEVCGFARLGRNSRIGKNCVIRGNIIVGDDTVIDNGAVIDGDAIIGSGVRIENYCHISGGSVVGNYCKILHAAEFDGVLFEKVYLYHYMEIHGLLGRCVDIGASTVCGTLRFDNGESRHRVRGRTETPRNFANATFIGDHSRTGVNVTFYPGVKVGCNSVIGPGVVVTQDVPSKTALLLKQELETKPWGPEKYGW